MRSPRRPTLGFDLKPVPGLRRARGRRTRAKASSYDLHPHPTLSHGERGFFARGGAARWLRLPPARTTLSCPCSSCTPPGPLVAAATPERPEGRGVCCARGATVAKVSRAYGTWDSSARHVDPALKMLGYFQVSLRDTRAKQLFSTPAAIAVSFGSGPRCANPRARTGCYFGGKPPVRCIAVFVCSGPRFANPEPNGEFGGSVWGCLYFA